MHLQNFKIEDKNKSNFEVVERKGKGHPDTLADTLAEELSKQYSRFTLQKIGYVLHHSFDRLMLLGGNSFVTFGRGHLIEPIKIILAGRITKSFGGYQTPVENKLIEATKRFFKINLPKMRLEKDLVISKELICNTSPCYVADTNGSFKSSQKYWFAPRNAADLLEQAGLKSTDAAIAAAYYPLSEIEKFVLDIEHGLNSVAFYKKHPWIGSDIKVVAVRTNDKTKIEIAVPQLADKVASLTEYKDNLGYVNGYITRRAKEELSHSKLIELKLNPRDDYKNLELYLTAIGTSLEKGDKGIVGRGNRQNGLITPTRPMSIEGRCGKIWFAAGKIFNLIASEIAREVSTGYRCYTEVYIVSHHWHKIEDPWSVIVATSKKIDLKALKRDIKDLMDSEHINKIGMKSFKPDY
jgi:S-adenosylmethionine synthetase